jgi:hypothetical protein
MKKPILILVCLLSITSIIKAGMQDSILDEVNNSASLNAGITYFKYAEPSIDTKMILTEPVWMKEYGVLPNIAINIRNVFYDRIYNEFYFNYSFGLLQYDGFYQFPEPFIEHADDTGNKYTVYKPIPVSQQKNSRLFNADCRLGVILLNTEYFQLIPYGNVGGRYWNIGDGGNRRIYYNFKASAGIKASLSFFNNLVLSSFYSIGTTMYPRVKFNQYTQEGAPDGSFSLSLGKKPVYEYGLEITYRLDHEIFLNLSTSYTKFKYGKSNECLSLSKQYIMHEPDSKTNELKITLGILFSFL